MVSSTRLKPWQKHDMNLYRAIRNCSAYWFVRLILEENATHATASSCGIHPAERRQIVRFQQNKAYWRHRRAGKSSDEAHALVRGTTPEAEHAYRQALNRRLKA